MGASAKQTRIGFAVGVALTLIAVSLLFGARNHPYPDANWSNPQAYYVIGEDRFDWFRTGEHVPNAWGGFTLDGRRITFVASSGPRQSLSRNPVSNGNK